VTTPICPCEDCLTLPVCKGRLTGGDIFDFLMLGDMCPPFREFLYPGGHAREKDSLTLVNIARKSLLKNIPFSIDVDWNRVRANDSNRPIKTSPMH
jgi:hypothetical protein